MGGRLSNGKSQRLMSNQFHREAARRARPENTGIRIRSLYKRCGRSRHPRAVRPRMGRPTVRYFGRVRFLRHSYSPNRSRSHPDLCGAGIASSKGAPRPRLCHLDPWDNNSSRRFNGDRTSSRRHRMVVAAGIRRLPPHSPSSFSPRRLHRIRMRSRSTRCLTIAWSRRAFSISLELVV